MSNHKTATPKLTLPKLGNDKPILLCVEDLDWYRAELCHQLLKVCGLRTLQANNGLAALRTLEKNPQILAVVSDWKFVNGGPDGIALLDAVKKRYPRTKRMLISAFCEPWMFEEGYAKGFSVRDKALPIAKLAESIGEWLE